MNFDILYASRFIHSRDLPMAARKNQNSSLVYSTAQGRMCPDCGKPVSTCTCRKGKASQKNNRIVQNRASSKNDGVVRVSRETKGRKGKGMTIVTGVPLHLDGIKDLARELKQMCGTGGTVKNGVIEIQGDHRDLLAEELKKRGWTVKHSGG